jgi:hypothetical protein
MGPETAMWLVPSIMGGMGAVGSALGSGAEGRLKGYGHGEAPPSRQSIDPSLLGQILAPIEQAIGISMGRMRQPVTLPGAFVQPNPMFSGGGLPMSIGTTGVDPALQQPHLMGLPGVNTGAGQLSSKFAPYIRQPGSGHTLPSKSPWGTIDQPAAQMPEAGGGMPQMQGALELLGVHSDPMGNLSSGGTGLFTGADPNNSTDYSDTRSEDGGSETNQNSCYQGDGYWCPVDQQCYPNAAEFDASPCGVGMLTS